MPNKIERYALRDIVHRKLLERILHGQLPPGSRVKDTDLSKEMHVSRTPVREALLRLVKEGYLENLVGRGFMVRALTRREVEEIYPIIRALEALALGMSGSLDPGLAARFEEIAEAMDQSRGDFIRLIDLDRQWHQALLSGCPNHRLLEMIADLKGIAFRYEYAFMQEMNLVETSMAEHRGIVDAVFNGDMDSALNLLREHWEFTETALLEKIEKN